MSSVSQPNERDDGLEAAVDQAIAACDGDLRAAVRALIVANNFLESEVAGLKKGILQGNSRFWGSRIDFRRRKLMYYSHLAGLSLCPLTGKIFRGSGNFLSVTGICYPPSKLDVQLFSKMQSSVGKLEWQLCAQKRPDSERKVHTL